MQNKLNKTISTIPDFFENDLVKIWKDEHHIIHTVYKPNVQITGESLQEFIPFRNAIHPGFPTGHFIDMRGMLGMEMSFRINVMKQNGSNHFKALAVVVGDPVSEMIAKMIGQFHPEVKTKTELFYNEPNKAYQWLLHQCKSGK